MKGNFYKEDLRKNILYISQYFPPETGAGATRSEAMVKYLSELGWYIEVLSELPNYPTGKIHKGYTNKLVQSEKLYNSWVHRVWVWANPRRNIIQQLGIFGSFLVMSVLYALCRLRNNHYDIVYATSPPIFAGIAGALIAKVSKSKFVLEVRDIWPDAAVDAGKIEEDSQYYRIGQKIESWLYSQADLIIPVTERAEAIIKKRGGNHKTQVIHNGVDLEHFYHRDNPESEMDESYDKEKFRVGYVGSLGVIHDLQTFVEAAKLCEQDDDFEFIIVGDGGSRQKLEDCLEQLKPRNLTWVGLKEHSKVPAYISSFDVAINPVYDAKIFKSIVTVKFYEYLACEVPVISMANGLHEIEGNKSNAAITLPPEHPEVLAEKLKELKNNAHLLNNYRSHARPYIESQYSRAELAGKTSKILHNLLKSD